MALLLAIQLFPDVETPQSLTGFIMLWSESKEMLFEIVKHLKINITRAFEKRFKTHYFKK